jgi:hypothetical protein
MAIDILAELRDISDVLTDPVQHREPIHGWDKNRNRKVIGHHVIVRPGLLAQVCELIHPGTPPDSGDFVVRSIPGSRPPLRTDAASAYVQIVLAATRWSLSLRLEVRESAESTIRQLLGRIAAEDRDTQAALLSEMRSWRRMCELITGVREPDPHLQVPCPRCGNRSLRVNLAEASARCAYDITVVGERRRCGAVWDEESGTIGVLARHIAEFQARAKADAARVRAEERERKLRRAGRAA